MRFQSSYILKRMRFGVLLGILLLAMSGIKAASAGTFQVQAVTLQNAVLSQAGSAKLTKVHHRKRRWRGRHFHLHFGHYGSPYFGYKYYGSRRYCRRQARRCAYRHGWRSWRWERCMRYRGCY